MDLQKFIMQEQRVWDELEEMLDRLALIDGETTLKMDEIHKLHRLYERASADLSRISTYSVDRKILHRLESLVARAYGEIHEVRKKKAVSGTRRWLNITVPRTVRKYAVQLLFSAAIFFGGSISGALFVLVDNDAKEAIMPFDHLLGSPRERVEQEEKRVDNYMEARKGRMAAWYMRNNISVSFRVFALGITWGIGTVLLLFSNGIMLGAVASDYMAAGKTLFLSGWLLPHGATEITAVLLSGQAAFVLAGAVLGRKSKKAFAARLRDTLDDLTVLLGAVVILLIWSGIIEAFISQYHEPVLPYWFKISFGVIELAALAFYFSRAGHLDPDERRENARS